MCVMNLKTLINKFSEHGFSDVRIAKELSTDDDNIPASIVNRWRHGKHKSTTYSRYMKVLDLHERIFKDK